MNRILFDSTNVNISIPGGGAFCTQAHLEAILTLYPGLVDVMHPEEAHIRDSRYYTIDVPKRTKKEAIIGFAKGYFYRGANFIVDYIKKHPDTYSIVFLNNGFYAGANIRTIQKYGIKTIVLHHNFELEYQLVSKSVFTFGGKYAFLINHFEKKGYLQSDINLFVTNQDLQQFEKKYGTRPDNFVSGTFEPTYEIQPLIKKELIENSAVITCALGDTQNQISIVNFFTQYLPFFLEVLPDWKIYLMGRNPSPSIIDIVSKLRCVTLIPNPVDLRALSAKSAIYLCPMDSGGGIKLRISDGLRAGQPILTHVRSSRGYEIFQNEPFFYTYYDTDSFKQALTNIITYVLSPSFSRIYIQKKYYDYFGLSAGVERLKPILCKLV